MGSFAVFFAFVGIKRGKGVPRHGNEIRAAAFKIHRQKHDYVAAVIVVLIPVNVAALLAALRALIPAEHQNIYAVFHKGKIGEFLRGIGRRRRWRRRRLRGRRSRGRCGLRWRLRGCWGWSQRRRRRLSGRLGRRGRGVPAERAHRVDEHDVGKASSNGKHRCKRRKQHDL